uniref:Testis expressed 11 n=1 Tax=Sarcophilus harrisii TaxID=9305 RepID=A0A7N4NK26_SARHA
MCLFSRDAVGFDFLKTVCNRLEWSAEVGKVFLLHIELLLQRKEDQLVKEKIENILAAHHAGKELPFKILNWLHNILWNQAAQNFEAYEAVKEAEIYDAANIFTQFIIFKIAVSRGNTDEALAAVDALEQCVANSIAQERDPNTEEISTTAFLSLAAQFALENGQQEVAIRSLEYLAQYSEDLQQVLIALKCLIRLVISQISHVVDLEENSYRNEEMSRLLFWVKTAYGKVASPIAKEKLTLEVWTNEVQWFRKIAWNLAMQCEKCLDIMRDFFLLSFELSQLCPTEKAVLVSQKTCLLMAAAADLELGRNATDASQKAEMLTHAIEHVHGCRKIVNILKQIGDNAKDPTENLLLLYEIEAKAKLNDPSLPSVLDCMWEMPHLETKILETIASVVMEPPAHYPEIAKQTLKKAISIYLQGTTINTMKYSKCLHSFINISLPDEVLEPDMHILEEIWSFFEDALNVISRSEYPQVKILWLMTKAWNTGIFQYGEGLYVIAEKWCGLGIRFLSHLGTLKKSYEGQMTDVYKEIVANIEREKCSPPNEE